MLLRPGKCARVRYWHRRNGLGPLPVLPSLPPWSGIRSPHRACPASFERQVCWRSSRHARYRWLPVPVPADSDRALRLDVSPRVAHPPTDWDWSAETVCYRLAVRRPGFSRKPELPGHRRCLAGIRCPARSGPRYVPWRYWLVCRRSLMRLLPRHAARFRPVPDPGKCKPCADHYQPGWLSPPKKWLACIHRTPAIDDISAQGRIQRWRKLPMTGAPGRVSGVGYS